MTTLRGHDAVDRHRASRLAELATIIDQHADGTAAVIPQLRLFRTDVAGEPTASIADPLFAFVAQGAKQIVISDRVLDYGPGEYLIVSLDLPVSGRFTRASRTEPFLGVGLTLEPDVIAALLAGAPTPPDRRSDVPAGPALGTAAATPELLDALVRLLRLTDAPDDRAVLGPLIYREILWRLLHGDQGGLVRQIGTGDSSLSRIAGSVRWIRHHYAEPFRVEQLARQASMSAPSFHRHFRSATSMGPLGFQKKIRLQQARLLLTSSPLDVGGVATAVGYDSASQFSREYRREWGVSPREDLRRESSGLS